MLAGSTMSAPIAQANLTLGLATTSVVERGADPLPFLLMHRWPLLVRPMFVLPNLFGVSILPATAISIFKVLLMPLPPPRHPPIR